MTPWSCTHCFNQLRSMTSLKLWKISSVKKSLCPVTSCCNCTSCGNFFGTRFKVFMWQKFKSCKKKCMMLPFNWVFILDFFSLDQSHRDQGRLKNKVEKFFWPESTRSDELENWTEVKTKRSGENWVCCRECVRSENEEIRITWRERQLEWERESACVQKMKKFGWLEERDSNSKREREREKKFALLWRERSSKRER